MGIAFWKAFVSGNGGVSLALLTLVGLALWRSAGSLPRPCRDPNRAWRVVGWTALGLQGVFFLWVSLFDYWRQVMGLLLTEQTRSYSDPYILYPVLARHEVAEPVRAISVTLLLAAALGLAILYYRHIGGVFLPLAMLVIGLMAYLIFAEVRQRMEFSASAGFPAFGRGTTADLLRDLAFFLPLVWFTAAIALINYLTLAALFAVPVIAIGGFLEERLIRPTDDYRRYSEALRTRAEAARARRVEGRPGTAIEQGAPADEPPGVPREPAPERDERPSRPAR